MRQHDADQQRLLLAGRAELGRHVLRAVAHQQVGAVRAVERAPAARSRVAAVRQAPAELLLDRRRPAVGRSLPPAIPASAMSACGNGPSSGSRSIMAAEQPDQFGARRGDRHAGLGHLRLDRLEPGTVARVLGKQPVAAAHRLLVVERPLAVAGIDRQHQPVEEAPAVAGRPGEQRVHGRRQPDHAQPFEQVPRRIWPLRR